MSTPSTLPSEYYNFDRYIDRARWLTYYRQLTLLQLTKPRRVLEVGVGPGIVRSVLRDSGVHVATVDVNDSLAPDFVADVRELPAEVSQQQWDAVLCSRVLHHIPVGEVPSVLDALADLQAFRTLITVPREDLSLQLTFRRTAGRSHSRRIPLGSALKRKLRSRGVIRSEPSGIWMLDDGLSLSKREFDDLIAGRFVIIDNFVLPDDPSHVFYLLGVRE